MFLLILLITPFILLPNHQPHLPPPNCHIHQSRMSDLNLDTMKQLLAEQAKSLLVEIREQVETEVRNQVAPHISRINQLEAEQILLKQQLNDLSDQLSQKCYSLPPTRLSSDILNTPEPPLVAPVLPTPLPTPSELESIEVARCTLTFQPITNITSMKVSETEGATTEVLMTRALEKFLHVNMSIPSSVTSKMNISNIWHTKESGFDKISVQFSSISQANTIFKYAKNLSPGQRVLLSIPPVLHDRHSDLLSQAYHLRNGKIRHQTVIKYLGNDLVLHTKMHNSRNWQLVPDKPPSPPLDTQAEQSLHAKEGTPTQSLATSTIPLPTSTRTLPIPRAPPSQYLPLPPMTLLPPQIPNLTVLFPNYAPWSLEPTKQSKNVQSLTMS